MSEVDKRVVEMSFENSSFEAGIRQSIATLEKMEQNLSRIKLSDSFNEQMSSISKAANNLDVSGLNSVISELQGKFTVLGQMGRAAITNITNSLVDLGKNFIYEKIGKPLETIISGGEARAANIEQARFMLEGLRLDVEKAMENANDAVSGTAYGLDSAAKAAGQLAASGIQLGDEMTSTLQGIAGVAAMTGSDFDSIAHIFENVAGQGRMMGDTLLMMSTRGLNASKDIADFFNGIKDGSIKANKDMLKLVDNVDKYFASFKGEASAQAKGFIDEAGNITEGGIRAIVSKGLITSDTFFTVMKNKYAEHAKEANKTYEGALMNVDAALKRIGEPFQTARRESIRQVAVEWINTLNGVAKLIKPLMDRFGWFQEKLAEHKINILKPINELLGEIEKDPDTGEIIPQTERAKFLVEGIGNAIKIPYRILKLILALVNKVKNTIKGMLPNTGSGLEKMANLMERIKKAIPFISLKDAFDGNYISPFSKTLTQVVKTIGSLVKIIGIGIVNLGRILGSVFEPVGAVFRLIGRYLSAFFGTLGDGAKKIREFADSLKDMTLGNDIVDVIKNFTKPITEFIDGIKIAKKTLQFKIKNPFKGFGSFLPKIDRKDDIATRTDKIKEAFNKINNSNLSFEDKIKAFQKLSNSTKDTKLKMDNFAAALKAFADKVKAIGKGITAPFKAIGNGLQKVFSGLFGGNKNIGKKLEKELTPYEKFVESVKKNMNNIFESLSTIEIPKTNLKDVLKFISEDLLDNILKIAQIILTVFRTITNIRIGRAMGAFGSFMHNINVIISTLGNRILNLNLNSVQNIMVSFGKAVLMLSASMLILALIPKNKLEGSMGMIAEVAGLVMGFFILVNRLPKLSVRESASVLALMTTVSAFAIAMLIFMADVAILAALPFSKMQGAMLGVAEIISIFGIVAKLLPKITEGLDLKSVFLFSTFVNSLLFAITSIAIAVAIMNIGSSGDSGSIATSVASIGAILLTFVGIIKLVSLINIDPRSMLTFGLGMEFLSLAIFNISIVLKLLSTIKTDATVNGVVVIFFEIMLMVSAMSALSHLIKKDAKGIIAASFSMNAMAIAMVIAATSMLILSKIKLKKVAPVITLFGALVVSMVVIFKTLQNVDPVNVLAIATAMIGMSVALNVVAMALNSMAGVDWKAFGIMVLSVGAMTASLAVLDRTDPSSLLITASAIVGFSIALVVLSNAATNFQAVDWDGFGRMALTVAVMVAAFEVLANTKTADPRFLISVSIAIISFAASVMILAQSLLVIDNLKNAWQSFGIMALSIGVLTAALLVFANINTSDILTIIVAIAGLSVILMAITGALKAVDELKNAWQSFAIVMISVGIITGALIALAVVMGALSPLITPVIAVLGGLIIAIAALVGVSAIFALALGLMANAITEFIKSVIELGSSQELMDKFGKGAQVIIDGILDAIHNGLNKAIYYIWDTLNYLVETMYTYLPPLIDKIITTITAIINQGAERLWSQSDLTSAMNNMGEALGYSLLTGLANSLKGTPIYDWAIGQAEAIKEDSTYRLAGQRQLEEYNKGLEEEQDKINREHSVTTSSENTNSFSIDPTSYFGNIFGSGEGLGAMAGMTQEQSAEAGKESGIAFRDNFKDAVNEDSNADDSMFGNMTGMFSQFQLPNFSGSFDELNNASDKSAQNTEKNENKKITAYKKEEEAIKKMINSVTKTEEAFNKKRRKYNKETGQEYKNTEKGMQEATELTAKKQKLYMAAYQHNNADYRKFVKDKIKWEKEYGEEYIKGENHINKAAKQAANLRKAASEASNKDIAKTYRKAAREIENSIKEAETKANASKIDTEVGKNYITKINKQIREGENSIAKESMDAMVNANKKAEEEAKRKGDALGNVWDKAVAQGMESNKGTVTNKVGSVIKEGADQGQAVADDNPIKIGVKLDPESVAQAKQQIQDLANKSKNINIGGKNGGKDNKDEENTEEEQIINNNSRESSGAEIFQKNIQDVIDGIGIVMQKQMRTSMKMAAKAGEKLREFTAHSFFESFGLASMHSFDSSKKYIGSFLTNMETFIYSGIRFGTKKWESGKFNFISLWNAVQEGLMSSVKTASAMGKDKIANVIGNEAGWLAKTYKKLYLTNYERLMIEYQQQGMSKKQARQRAKIEAEKIAAQKTSAKAMAAAYLWENSEKYKDLKQKQKDNAKEIKQEEKHRKKLKKKYGSLNKLKKEKNKAEKKVKENEKALEDFEKKHGKKSTWSKEEKEEYKKLKEKLKNSKKDLKQKEESISKWKEYNKNLKQLYKQKDKLDQKMLDGYKEFLKEWRKEQKEALKEQLTENFLQEIRVTWQALATAMPKNVSILIGQMEKVIDIFQVASQTASNSISLIQSSMTQFTDIIKSSFDTGISVLSDVSYDWMNTKEMLYNMDKQTETYDKYIENLKTLRKRAGDELYKMVKDMGYSSEGISYLNAFVRMSDADLKKAESYLAKVQADEVAKYLDSMQTTMSDFSKWKSEIDNNLGIDSNWLKSNGFTKVFDDLIDELKEGGIETLDQITLIKNMTQEQLKEFLELYRQQQEATSSSYLDSIEANSKAYAEWVDNLDKLRKMLDSGKIDQALYDQLKAMGIDGRDYIDQIINMNDEQLDRLNSYFDVQQNYNSHAVIDDMKQSLISYQEWLDNMMVLKTKVSKEMYKELNNMGYAGAATVANFANMTAEDLAQAEKLLAAQNRVNAASYMNDMEMQLVTYQKWINDLAALEAGGINHALLKELEAAGVQNAEQVSAFVNLMNQGQMNFINKEYNDSMKMNTNNWINDLKKNADDYKEFYTGLAKLQSGSVKDGAGQAVKLNKGLLEELKEMGVEGLDYVRAFLSDSGAEAVKAANEAYDQQQKVTKANMLMDMKAEQQKARQWALNIKQMAEMGYDVDFVNDLIEQGYDATSEQVALFVDMTDSEVAEVNNMWKDIDSLSTKGAKQLQNAIETAFGEGHTKYDQIMAQYSGSTKTNLSTIAEIFGEWGGIISEDFGHDGSDAGSSFISSIVGQVVNDATGQSHSNQEVDNAASNVGASAGTSASTAFAGAFIIKTQILTDEIHKSVKEATGSAEPNVKIIAGNLGQEFNIALGNSIYTNRVSSVKDKIIAMFDKIIENQKENIKNKGERIGKFIDKGIANGITDSSGKVFKAIEDLCKKIIEKAEKKLDINSPSKVFYSIGTYVDEGMANGITNSLGLVENASATLADTAIRGAENALDGLDAKIQNGSSEVSITPIIDSDSALTGLDAIRAMSLNTGQSISTLSLNNISQVSAIADLYSQVSRLADAVNSINDYSEVLGRIDLLIGEYLPQAANTDVYLDGAKISQNVDRRLTDSINRRATGW